MREQQYSRERMGFKKFTDVDVLDAEISKGYPRSINGNETTGTSSTCTSRIRLYQMTLADVQRFEPLFDSGDLLPPRWLPEWVSRANGLAGMLAYSLFANRIRLDQIMSAERVTDI